MDEQVPEELVTVAIDLARRRGDGVADIPLTELARAAGVSRSTLLRRLGGSRAALDDAVRAAGVDPGGQRSVRERAIEAGALLISREGLAAATLEAVAGAAGCSLHSLHAAFGGRDGLLTAIYERHSPLSDLEGMPAEPADDLGAAVRAVHRSVMAALGREPRVAPAILADLFSRPDGPAGRLFRQNFPRVAGGLGGWLEAEVTAGRIRALPMPLLMQQLVAPLAVHMLVRPVAPDQLPELDEVCEVFADAFLRSVAVAGADGPGGTEEGSR